MSQAFEIVIQALASSEAVETGKMFGSTTLKRSGKVFAMEVKGKLVVKLAEPRAARIVESGAGTFFDPGHGRPSRQWVSVPPTSPLQWTELAAEALELAESSGRSK